MLSTMTDATPLPATMAAVLLTGHGGFDKLEYRTDVPVPVPGPGEITVRVGACGLNNTDINTRIGWYSSAVRDGVTADSATAGLDPAASESGGWGGALPFPLIQGADVCGRVAAVGDGVNAALVGRRVMIDPWLLDPADPTNLAGARYVGSEVDGGFAEYCRAPAANVHPVESPLSDAELATFPCAATTAENLLTKAVVGADDVVIVTGASGGVGTTVVQLARARGAHVIAVAAGSKAPLLVQLGADAVVDRDDPDLAAAVRRAAPGGRVDAMIDVVGASMFERLIPALRQGGRYATSGAIAGPIVELDLRWLIYGDLQFSGATVCPPGTFAKVITMIESGVLRPILAASYALAELQAAQEEFLAKRHVGNIVVTMPARA